MFSYMDLCILAFAIIGFVRTLVWIWPNSWLGKRIRPPPPPPPPVLAEIKAVLEAILRKMDETITEDRHQRANPPEMEVVATLRPRYRTRANSAAEGSREPTL